MIHDPSPNDGPVPAVLNDAAYQVFSSHPEHRTALVADRLASSRWRPIVVAFADRPSLAEGDLANELMDAGVPWPDHEAEALRRACSGDRI